MSYFQMNDSSLDTTTPSADSPMLSDSLLQLAKETPQQLQKDIEDAIKYLDSITIDADHIQEVQTINDNLTEEQDQMIMEYNELSEEFNQLQELLSNVTSWYTENYPDGVEQRNTTPDVSSPEENEEPEVPHTPREEEANQSRLSLLSILSQSPIRSHANKGHRTAENSKRNSLELRLPPEVTNESVDVTTFSPILTKDEIVSALSRSPRKMNNSMMNEMNETVSLEPLLTGNSATKTQLEAFQGQIEDLQWHIKILKMKNESMKEAIKSDREKNELLDSLLSDKINRRESLATSVKSLSGEITQLNQKLHSILHKNEVDYKHELKKYLTLHPYVVYFLYACAFGIGCCFSSKINSLLDYYGMKE